MERRSLAKVLGAVLLLPGRGKASLTAEPVIDIGGSPVFAVWAGEASIVPAGSDYTLVRDPGYWLQPDGRDIAEIELLLTRVQTMPVGAADHIRTFGDFAHDDGQPGIVRITRIA